MGITAQRVGDRLRSIRRQKGLSLHEVEAMSSEEFKASVLGAYERGERVISVPRLIRLAGLYGVPAEQLLPRDVEVDLTERTPVDLRDGFTVDLTALAGRDEGEAQVLAGFVGMVQAQRQDFNGRVLTIRGDDIRTLAFSMRTSPEDFCEKIAGLGLRSVAV